MKILLSWFIIFAFVQIWPCTIVYHPPCKFDPDEFIFIGRIVSHIVTDGIDPKYKSKFQYNGLLLELEEEIYLPEKQGKLFEVYPLSLGADCHEGPQTKSYLESLYPVGSQIRVVAKKPKIDFGGGLNIRLVSSPHNQYTLSLNFANLVSTGKSFFNYSMSHDSLRSLAKYIADSLGITDNEKRNVIVYSTIYLKDFELRKDLYRLHMSNDDREKAGIIYRLKNFRELGSDLIKIIYEYIKNESIRDKLFLSLFEIREKVPPVEWITR